MRAIIIGGGIAGLATAWWLRREGWQATVVERAPAPSAATGLAALDAPDAPDSAEGTLDRGYVIDYFGPGYDTLERMGLRARVHEYGLGLNALRYRRADGRDSARIDASVPARLTGGRYLTLLRGDLERVLRQALGPAADVRYGTGIDQVRQDEHGVTAVLTDGSAERADVLVGADGIHSRTRRLVFGPESRYRRYLGAHAAAYVFSDPELMGALANEFQAVEAPGVQAGMYRLSDTTGAAFLCHLSPDGSLPQDPRARLRRVHGDLGWLVPRLLAACPPRPYYDEVEQIIMPGWSAARVVLVGDACQAVSLMAGQGASMAVAAAEVLAQELGPLAAGRRAARGAPTGGTTEEITAALRRYEGRVKPVIDAKQRAGRGLARWFVPATATRLFVRRQALRLSSTPLAERVMRPFLAAPRDAPFDAPVEGSRR
ncbi:2-polyprenyl-6-methoxyphenol hydroxylase-like FAD-dependent oxidoreductase [Nocardiopsis sp. Huas11]|uniref:FAD-dependent oxidoreductase n=1 Tax=Nocardiopsis sp. Huas11 TaxID=2183912 RepID=UPI000F2844DE|nr:FAD-dependent oxidoreductase [Nocardiopsis sp. Huas11]RKS08978.1 2-polyprenyl-6-methoxyphenol hydroxylase-like FAD-dependent oxidoreductase [Nocardiopsis sp. Huas11]